MAARTVTTTYGSSVSVVKKKPVTRSDADCGGTDFYDHRMLVDVPQGWCGAPCRTGSNAEGIRGCVPKSLKKSLRDTHMLLEKRRKAAR